MMKGWIRGKYISVNRNQHSQTFPLSDSIVNLGLQEGFAVVRDGVIYLISVMLSEDGPNINFNITYEQEKGLIKAEEARTGDEARALISARKYDICSSSQ